VLGTIHIADSRVSRVTPAMANAMDRTRTLALESVPLPHPVYDADTLQQLDGGGRLEPLLGPALYSRVRSELAAQGVPEATIERLKPWAALLSIARIAPQEGERSPDENLVAAARERHMRISALENVDEQAVAFDALPMRTQVALLDHAIAHRDALAGRVESAVDAWLRGDLVALARANEHAGDAYPGMQRHYAALNKHIVCDRTVLLHHRLFLALRGGRVFVAVGAAHLYGKEGLLALLREDGYRVTRVW
jgi:uncharacterized protein YbaP (TraB family)